MWVFLLGPALFLLFCCFSSWRNANLAGGFAGRSCWVLVFCCVVMYGFAISAFWVPFTQIFTAYAIVRTEPSALSATPEEKKSFGWIRFLYWAGRGEGLDDCNVFESFAKLCGLQQA